MNCHTRYLTMAGVIILLASTGCTLKATFNQTTDTTSNVTGTTSGAAWWNEDGQITPDFKAIAFVSYAYDNLRQDLAAGQGEYLASVSRLLDVPADRQSAFFSAAQAGYETMGDQGPTTLLALLRDRAQPFVN